MIHLLKQMFLAVTFGRLLLLPLIVLTALLILGGFIYKGFKNEVSYRLQYGEAWKESFERDFGTVEGSRLKIFGSFVGFFGITSASIWLYRQVPRPDGLRRHSRRRTYEPSPTSHNRVRCRKFALWGVASGLFGIAIGIGIALFPIAFGLGSLADPEDPMLIGGGVFFAGYCGLILGCYWWLRKKGWNEVLVIIGLLPLLLLCIPFVRIALLAVPQVLVVGMVMMPLVLITVIMVLPDRSGRSLRRR